MAQILSKKFKTTQKNEEKIEKSNLITTGVSVCHKKCFHVQSNCQLTSPKSRYYKR